jgi:hypothetical protein
VPPDIHTPTRRAKQEVSIQTTLMEGLSIQQQLGNRNGALTYTPAASTNSALKRFRGGAHNKLHTAHTPHSAKQRFHGSWHAKVKHNPSSRHPPLTTGTHSLHGPPTPSFSHRSRSFSSHALRGTSATAAVGATTVTVPHSCCNSTPSTASRAGAGVVPIIRTTITEPSMVTTAGGLGITSTRPKKEIRASCETS